MKRLDGFYIKPRAKGGFVLDMTRQGLRSKTIISGKQAEDIGLEILSAVIDGVPLRIKRPKWRDRPGGADVIFRRTKAAISRESSPENIRRRHPDGAHALALDFRDKYGRVPTIEEFRPLMDFKKEHGRLPDREELAQLAHRPLSPLPKGRPPR